MVTLIKSRLGLRLLIFLLAGVILSFGILTYLVVARERAILMEFNREESSILADSITKNLRGAMLEKDLSVVTRMLERYNSVESIKAAVFRGDGSLAYGNLDYTVPRDMIVSPQATSVRGKGNLVFLKPLFNEKECHACHESRDRIRGIVAIRISTERAEQEAANTAKRIAAFAAVIAFLSGVGFVLVIRGMISRPLKMLKDGTEKIKDGELGHRIAMDRDDELGLLSSGFNRMAETIENAHKHLEEAVHRKTKELRVVAELSSEVFREDLSMDEILEKFLSAITDDLGYAFCAFCFIDKENGMLSLEHAKNADAFCKPDIALSDDHPVVKAMLEAKTAVIGSRELGLSGPDAHVALIPVISHMRHCWEVNHCAYAHCPAFRNSDRHCWLTEETLCRSPHSVKGKAKIYGCVSCGAFPVIGLIAAARKEEIGKSSIHSLEIISSEVASALENYRLIEDKKRDIRGLVKLHDASVRSTQYLSMPELTSSIVSAAAQFSGADAAVLWFATSDGSFQYQDAFGVDPAFVPSLLGSCSDLVGRAIKEDRPIETVNTDEIQCLGGLIRKYDFLYAAAIPLHGKKRPIGCLTLLKKRDFFMSDSEKAIIALYASQAASSLTVARTYSDLKNQKELSDAIFNCTMSGVAVLDRDGIVININQAGLEILRLSDETVYGRKLLEIFPETKDMLSFGGNLSREVSVAMAGGTVRPIGFTNSPLFDKNGNEKGIVVIFRDLTEIKELQAEVRKKHHFESMGKVISGVAHEVRNPLFAIQSVAQILEREIEDEQHQALLVALLKETGRMRKLVDELLVYGKPSSLNIVDLGLAPLFEEMKNYCSSKEPEALLALNIQPSTTVMADKDKLTQVLLNLLDNALGAGGRRIDISSKEMNGVVRVSLRDDGLGIKKEDLEKVFDPFFTTKKEGTGLGLSICKKIIEDHGGSIEVLSTEGKGTTVTLSLRNGKE